MLVDLHRLLLLRESAGVVLLVYFRRVHILVRRGYAEYVSRKVLLVPPVVTLVEELELCAWWALVQDSGLVVALSITIPLSAT